MSHVETAWVISRLLDDITALTAERDAALAEVDRLQAIIIDDPRDKVDSATA
jgi:hypothetical protein